MEIVEFNIADVIKTSGENGWVDDPYPGDGFDNEGID